MTSQSLVVKLIERLRYRYRKFIQRFLATISAIIFISFDLFIPAATEAFVPSPVLALVGDTVAFGVTIDLAIIAAPIVVAGVLAAGAVYYVWSQEQTDQAQALAQQKYCAANTTAPVCGGQMPGVPYRVIYDIEWIAPYETYEGTGYWHTGWQTISEHFDSINNNGSTQPYGPIYDIDVQTQGQPETYGYDNVNDFYGGYWCNITWGTSTNTQNWVSGGARWQPGHPPTLKNLQVFPLNGQPDTGPPLDWGDWPDETRSDATNLLTDDDLTPILQSGQAGTLTAGQNLPYGIWTSPGPGQPFTFQPSPITVPAPGSSPDPNPNPIPSSSPDPSPSPYEPPSPSPDPSPSGSPSPSPPTASGGGPNPSPSPSSDPSPSPSGGSGKGDTSPEAVENWAQNLPTKQTPTNSQAERYEIQQTGPENIQVQGGGEQVWADGIRPSDSKLLDAKYVKNPDNSPYVPDSNMDEDIRGIINTKTDNEFRRYGAVINDPNTPVTGLEVITNEPRAVPYFQGLMNKYNIPGDVVVKP